MEIYYIYLIHSGEYQGNGITYFDTETYKSTTIPTPQYGDDEMVYFIEGEWIIKKIEKTN